LAGLKVEAGAGAGGSSSPPSTQLFFFLFFPRRAGGMDLERRGGIGERRLGG
jgi:hypothetical protein